MRSDRPMSVIRVVVLVVLALVASACTPDESGAFITTSSTTEAVSSIDLSDYEPGGLVLRVTGQGPIAASELAFRLPPYSLYADGTLLVPGSMPVTSALRPVLQPVDKLVLTETELERALLLIEAIGLVTTERAADSIQGPGGRTIIDAGTTIATFTHPDGGTSTYSVYAFDSYDGSSTLSAATAGLVELLALLDEAVATTRSLEQYEPERIRVTASGPDQNPGLILPWPLPFDPLQFEIDGRFDIPCHVFGGEAGDAAIRALAAETSRTSWAVGDVTLRIRARVVLPGETGCGELPMAPDAST